VDFSKNLFLFLLKARAFFLFFVFLQIFKSNNYLYFAAASGSGDNNQARQQAIQQQQNATALLLTTEKTRNTLCLLANGFSKTNASSSSFNYVRGAASSLAASAGSKVTSSPISTVSDDPKSPDVHNQNANTTTSNTSRRGPVTSGSNSPSPGNSGSVINREVRIGVAYAYVELANLLGSEWLEKNLKLFLSHVLNLVNNTKAVSTHLDAVYSRKCVQFILR